MTVSWSTAVGPCYVLKIIFTWISMLPDWFAYNSPAIGACDQDCRDRVLVVTQVLFGMRRSRCVAVTGQFWYSLHACIERVAKRGWCE